MAPVRRPFPRTHGPVALVAALALAMTLVTATTPAVAADSVSISGVVFDSDGSTAGYQYIEAYLPDGGPGAGTLASQVRADIDGGFRLSGLEAGREYRLRIAWADCCGALSTVPSFQGFATNDPLDSMTQDPSRAALFDTGPSGLTGVRLALEPSTEISGRVVTSDGAPIEGMELGIIAVTDYRDLITTAGSVHSEGATSGADGTFRAKQLQFIGEEVRGYVIGVTFPYDREGYVGEDPQMGLVPIDQARIFPARPDALAGIEIVLPQAKLPADQIILGPRIAFWAGSGDGVGHGQVMSLGSGVLSVWDLENGALTRQGAIRSGLEGHRLYAPGDWGGVPRDWLPNINPGWSHFEYRDDIISVDQRGDMYLYEGDGAGHLREPRLIGWGWNGYRVIPSGDLDGDHHLDLLAIDPDGYLKLYRGDGKGGFFSPYPQVGWGWIGFELYAAGDLTQDGRNDILSVDPGGILYLYPGNGDGTFQDRRQVGYGWGTYTLAAGADIDGYTDPNTGQNVQWPADIVGRDDATGDLYLYSGKGDGTFPTKTLIATGW